MYMEYTVVNLYAVHPESHDTEKKEVKPFIHQVKIHRLDNETVQVWDYLIMAQWWMQCQQGCTYKLDTSWCPWRDPYDACEWWTDASWIQYSVCRSSSLDRKYDRNRTEDQSEPVATGLSSRHMLDLTHAHIYLIFSPWIIKNGQELVEIWPKTFLYAYFVVNLPDL